MNVVDIRYLKTVDRFNAQLRQNFTKMYNNKRTTAMGKCATSTIYWTNLPV